MAKAKYKNEESLKNAKEKFAILKFGKMKKGGVFVNIKKKSKI